MCRVVSLATVDAAPGKYRRDGARDAACRGDQPEGVEHHLDGDRQQPVVHHALQHAHKLAVAHLGYLARRLDHREGLVIEEVGTAKLNDQEHDETCQHRAKQKQHDAQHPQRGILAEAVFLDEHAALVIVHHQRRANHQNHEDVAQRHEPIDKNSRDTDARQIQSEWYPPHGSPLIDADALFFHTNCKITNFINTASHRGQKNGSLFY